MCGLCPTTEVSTRLGWVVPQPLPATKQRQGTFVGTQLLVLAVFDGPSPLFIQTNIPYIRIFFTLTPLGDLMFIDMRDHQGHRQEPQI